MNDMLNSKLMGLLASVDKEKLDQVSNMIRNMPKQDIENIINMLGITNQNKDNLKNEDNLNV